MCIEAEALRLQLGSARLDLRAFFHGCMRACVFDEMPGELQRIRKLDTRLAGALKTLSREPTGSDLTEMKRYAGEYCRQVSKFRNQVLEFVDVRVRIEIELRAESTRSRLDSKDAYLDIDE